jgi:cytidylate kinase
MSTLQIAIDGTAASGKSTVAKRLAEKLSISYLDTGKLYRAVALAFLRESAEEPPQWSQALASSILARTSLQVQPAASDECRVHLQGADVTDELGGPKVEGATSFAARLPCVRAWLLDLQRDLARRFPIVMAGRDIGTVVLPDADLKVFMVADLQERARRRLVQQGVHFGPEELEQAVLDLSARDQRDASRECAPMLAAPDSLQLDSTSHTPEELVDLIIAQLQQLGRLPANPATP